MNAKDQAFFEKHWKEWVARNPPPPDWPMKPREWAELEMPCRGFLGKLLFDLELNG